MKHLKWIVGILLLAIVPVFAWTQLASAQRFTSSVDKGQTVNSSVYSSGKSIDIAGTINGDVYCMGQTVTINADVRGDIICAGQDVTVNGTVDGNVRVAGQIVSVGATVSRSATIVGQTVSLDADARIGSDLTITGDSLNIKGEVMRDVVAKGTSLTFNGIVGRDVKASSSQIKLKDHAAIAGDFNYSGTTKVTLDKGALVKGDTVQVKSSDKASKSVFNRYSLGFYLFTIFSLGIIALALVLLFPRFLRANAARIKDDFTKTLIVGLVASFLVPMISLGLVLTVVGIPLVLFMMIAWLFGTLVSIPIVVYYAGQLVLRKQQNPALIVLVGSAVLVTASYLPLAGVLVVMVAYWLGFGALVQALRAHMGKSGDVNPNPVVATETKPKIKSPKKK